MTMKPRWNFFIVIPLWAGISVLWPPHGYAADEKKRVPMPAASVQGNMTVELEYTLTVDGKVVDSSVGHEPLKYVQGKSQIIPGLERELAGLHVGDSKEVTVKPADGYGELDPAAFIEIPKAQLPKENTPQVGMVIGGTDPSGYPFRARVSEVKDQTVTLDLNHPLAGKILNFKVKILSINPAPEK